MDFLDSIQLFLSKWDVADSIDDHYVATLDHLGRQHVAVTNFWDIQKFPPYSDDYLVTFNSSLSRRDVSVVVLWKIKRTRDKVAAFRSIPAESYFQNVTPQENRIQSVDNITYGRIPLTVEGTFVFQHSILYNDALSTMNDVLLDFFKDTDRGRFEAVPVRATVQGRPSPQDFVHDEKLTSAVVTALADQARELLGSELLSLPQRRSVHRYLSLMPDVWRLLFTLGGEYRPTVHVEPPSNLALERLVSALGSRRTHRRRQLLLSRVRGPKTTNRRR